MLSINIVQKFGSRVYLLGSRPMKFMAFAVCVCFFPLRAAAVSDLPTSAATEGEPFTLSCSATIKSPDFTYEYGFTASFFLADKRLFFWQGRDNQTQNWLDLDVYKDVLRFSPGGADVISISRITGRFGVTDIDGTNSGDCSRIQYWPPPENKF